MELNKIYNMDCIEQLKALEDNSVDSIVTDPPYELGFMGKSWDNTGIANDKSMWAECLRVLKPGGYLLSFGGTRTYHRMACAIEDAGFEVRDMIEWVYGSGFPKSLNIGKQIDKIQGNERELVGKRSDFSYDNSKRDSIRHNKTEEIKVGASDWNNPVTKGTSEWEGWGTALKPAHEPICMARKPLAEKTVAENVLKYGTGGINIDESRVDGKTEIHSNGKRSMYGGNSLLESKTHNDKTEVKDYGRFPANLIHDNSEEVRECFPETKSQSGGRSTGRNFGQGENEGGKDLPRTGHNDSGNASRFFKSINYQAKASKSERGEGNNHPTVKPVKLMEYLINMVTPKGGVVLDPFAGSGTTGVACQNTGRNFILIECEEKYCKIAKERLNQSNLLNKQWENQNERSC